MEVTLERVARELKVMREMMSKIINYMVDAESEIPEKMRRFMNYMHDIHDIKYMYEELGHPVPQHHLRELERCDDRFRQLIAEQNAAGGTFDKVRREMAADPMNRFDHTRQLAAPTHKEYPNETRPSQSLGNGSDQSGASPEGSIPGGGEPDRDQAGESRNGQG
jgi:hypothetical protein